MKVLWIALGWTSVGLGVVGTFLPLLPTTPFLLLAAFAFSRGSETLHDWLMTHPSLGPPIHDWHQHRAVSRRVKVVATFSIIAIFALAVLLAAPAWALITQATVWTFVLLFLWTRHERPDANTLTTDDEPT